MDNVRAIYDYISGIQEPLTPSSDSVHFNPFSRTFVDLKGEWHYAIDPFDIGLRKRWYEKPGMDAAGHDLPVDFDTEAWPTMPLPGNWNEATPELKYYEGAIWFAREVTFQSPIATPTFLHFEGSNYRTDVWLDEHYLGSHEGGFTPFTFDVTDLISGRPCQLLLRVDNSRLAERVPGLNFDWFNYGGVYRSFGFYTVPRSFISDAQFRYDGGTVSLDIWLGGELTTSQALTVVCSELGIKESVSVSTKHVLLQFACNPLRWSPERPNLYNFSLELEGDRVEEKIGFRTIKVELGQICLNGEPVYVRGVCLHEERTGRGRCLNDDDIRQALGDAKGLGCNLVRLAHYPHSRRVAQLADELGLLLWEEIPVYWDIAFQNTATRGSAQAQLTSLVRRDFNRASVMFWSVANETPITEARMAFLSDLVSTVRSIDPTRLITAAMTLHPNKGQPDARDPLESLLDVVGINQYFGWYYHGFDALEHLLTRLSRGKPYLISEVGAGALAGFRSKTNALFSEERQAWVIEQQLKILERHDHVKGICFWVLYDFACPGRQNRYQSGFNRKGLISEDRRQKKLGYELLKRAYQQLAERELKSNKPLEDDSQGTSHL